MEKKVAILVLDPVFAGSLKSGVKTIDSVNFEIYLNYEDLIKSILAGEISGVIGIETDAEKCIRHDLKDYPGFDFKKAREFSLPEIINLYHRITLNDILSFGMRK